MKEEISKLLNTSVDDMRSSLDCQFRNNTLTQRFLIDALLAAEKRKEKTKALIIEQYLKKLMKGRT